MANGIGGEAWRHCEVDDDEDGGSYEPGGDGWDAPSMPGRLCR